MTTPPRDDHLRTRDPGALARRALNVVLRPGDSLVVAEGQYSPKPTESIRVALLVCGERGVRRIEDAWVRTPDLDRLRQLLRASHAARAGEADAMYATAWERVWTIDEAPFVAWDSQGRIAWQETFRLYVRVAGSHLVEIDRARIGHVHGYLGEGWVRRGVALRLDDGAVIHLSWENDPAATIDPTYDAFSVMCDASWVRSFAQALGAALQVPVRIDEPL